MNKAVAASTEPSLAVSALATTTQSAAKRAGLLPPSNPVATNAPQSSNP